MTYTPSEEILNKYADVMVNFALGGGKGMKKGDIVNLIVPESAKPFLNPLQAAILKAGGHIILSYIPEGYSKVTYQYASDEQLDWAPKKYMEERVNAMDHSLFIIATDDKYELKGIAPEKIIRKQKSMKFYRDLRDKKEDAGKFTWTLCLYGTEAMAKDAGLTLKDYWNEIIKACFLDEKDPIAKWNEVYDQIYSTQKKLNKLEIDYVHVEAEDVDLKVKIGEKRKWLGGSGRNIPSFELFISPDWRGTNGKISFNQPLYRYGNRITGIELQFKDGIVVKAKAKENEKLLKEMIAAENANKIGEFSLTDKRFSRITKFMGETLFDENVGGKFGNTHIALGSAYTDSYSGDVKKVTKKQLERLGFNDSVIHTDIMSTTDRTATAYLKDGSSLVIYRDGMFQV